MIDNQDKIFHRLKKFHGRSNIIKMFNPFQSRDSFQCPPRLVANIYVGCAYRCNYCYGQYIPDFFAPRPKLDFRHKLDQDLKLIEKYDLKALPVSVANSTEPLQPIEDNYRHTQHLLTKLNRRKFKIIMITKNPRPLLTEPYIQQLHPSRTYIQVSLPFLYSRKDSLEPGAPLPQERLAAVGGLVEKGFTVAVRIDPLIPNISGIKGQSKEEIHRLVGKLSGLGVDMLIAKSTRLVGAINKEFPQFYQGLKPFFQENGEWQNNCYELGQETQTELLMPVYEACKKEGLQLSTCYERHETLPEAFRCDQSSRFFAHVGGGMDKEHRSQEEKVQLEISR